MNLRSTFNVVARLESWLHNGERESALADRKDAMEAHRKAWATGDTRRIHETRQRLQAATNQCLRVGA